MHQQVLNIDTGRTSIDDSAQIVSAPPAVIRSSASASQTDPPPDLAFAYQKITQNGLWRWI
jgi:hypothetical protein